MINQHGSIDHFTVTRINPRWSLSISHPDRTITYTRIFDIIRIKLRVIFRKIIRLNSIFETDFFKSLVPKSDSRMNGSLPFVRKCIVHVINDRFHWFHQFSPLISLHILRLKVPAINIINVFHAIQIIRNHLFTGNEITDTRVCQTGTHPRFFRQQYQ